MSKARELLEQSAEMMGFPVDAVEIKKEFTKLFDRFDIDGVEVLEVDFDFETGAISVVFGDFEGDEMEIQFLVDEDDVFAMVADDEALENDDTSDDDIWMVELTPLDPVILMDRVFGPIVNLTTLDWMTKSTLVSMLMVGEVGIEPDDKPAALKALDAFGNVMGQGPYESLNIDEAGFATVVRGGKRVKLPLVRRKRRKVLSGKQKQSLRRAALKRKAKKSQISRKRKRSLKIRKRLGLKKRSKNTNRLKVQGGANRPRSGR